MIKTCVILYVAHVIHLNTLYLYILIAKQNFQYDQFFLFSQSQLCDGETTINYNQSTPCFFNA